MTKDEADDLLALVDRVWRAVWNLECSCPGRSETEAVASALDGLVQGIQEMANDPAGCEHDV